LLCLGTALKLGPILRQPLSQTAPLQHGRKALHRRRPTLLRSLYRAISRHSYDQLGALKPVFGPERPLTFCAAAKSWATFNVFMICPPNGRRRDEPGLATTVSDSHSQGQSHSQSHSHSRPN